MDFENPPMKRKRGRPPRNPKPMSPVRDEVDEEEEEDEQSIYSFQVSDTSSRHLTETDLKRLTSRQKSMVSGKIETEIEFERPRLLELPDRVTIIHNLAA